MKEVKFTRRASKKVDEYTEIFEDILRKASELEARKRNSTEVDEKTVDDGYALLARRGFNLRTWGKLLLMKSGYLIAASICGLSFNLLSRSQYIPGALLILIALLLTAINVFLEIMYPT